MARLTNLYATDEDIAIATPGDFLLLCPKDQKMAYATDGIFDPSDRWTLTSATEDFQGQQVAPGMVVQLLRPNPPFKSPELLVVDSVVGHAVTLRRKGQAAGFGEPPAPAGGLSGVEFLIATLLPQVERASYSINQHFDIDETSEDHKFSDIVDPREATEATVEMVLYRQYRDLARDQSKGDSFFGKAEEHRKEYDSILERTTLRLKSSETGEAELYFPFLRVVR